jgi:CRISPR-associated protein Cas5h
MEPENLYGIELEADYGHFRKNFTTSSPLTYGVPPRTAVSGLLGAIFGLPRSGDGNYHEVFSDENSFIAVVNRPNESTEKQTINLNLLKIKGETEKLVKLDEPPEEITRSQVPFEVVKNPRYRIYFNSKALDEIEEFLKEEKSVYTPYFGISEYIADYTYLGKFEVERREGEELVDSVVPAEKASQFEQGKKYLKENVSLFMNPEREVQKFGEVIYEENGEGVKVDTDYFQANRDKIIPLR